MGLKPKHAKKSSASSKIWLIAAFIIVAAVIAVIWAGVDGRGETEGGSSLSASADVPQLSEQSDASSSDSPTVSDSGVLDPSPETIELDAGLFSSEGGRIYYDGDVFYGIDVSRFQGEIDWEAVAADGIDFAIIRAGLRGYETPNLVEDPMCRDNIAAALAAGLDVGLYFHSQAITADEAVEEAQFLLGIAQDYEITYPLVIDWERQTADTSRTRDIEGGDVTAFCAAFCEEIENSGYTAAFYFNPTDSSSGLDAGALSDYIFWMAQYDADVPDLSYDLDIWQYSNTGSVSGIEGNVDLNICFCNFSSAEGE